MKAISARIISKSNYIRHLSSLKAAPASYLNISDVQSRVIDTIQRSVKSSPFEIKIGDNFVHDLRFDSLDRTKLFLSFGEEFRVPITEEVAESFTTVENVVQFFASHPKAR